VEWRVGITVEGRSATLTASQGATLVLLGDAGRGKTTTARHLTRRWLADTARHAHLDARSPTEWADLISDGRVICQRGDWNRSECDCTADTCLWVVDDLVDHLKAALAPLQARSAPAILTSRSAVGLAGWAQSRWTWFGLLRPELADATDLAVWQGQRRLDWPSCTTPVIADDWAPLDRAPHRWQTRLALGRVGDDTEAQRSWDALSPRSKRVVKQR
jgi:energy-coupling factor transporter ATP-binding protein EcfA2